MNKIRFQVVEVAGGWAVMDTRDNTIWTHTYVKLGWAVRRATMLQESHGKRVYF
jgi:hypothetical protein